MAEDTLAGDATVQPTNCPRACELSRRYKQLACRLEAFIEFLGDLGMTLIADASLEVVYQDKSLFKAKGPVWHQKDRNANRLPKGLRAVDTDASWSVSKLAGFMAMDCI